MKLHQDREALGDLLSDVSRRTDIRSDIIEKDYYLISPLLYSEATQLQRQVLESNYEVRPFVIGTVKMERIFADKILAAEFPAPYAV